MRHLFVPYPNTWITSEISVQLGKAVWLLLLLLDLTTRSIDGLGLVFGGTLIEDEDLNARLDVHRNTLRRHRRRLEAAGFIITLTIRNGLRRWFIIGCQKYESKKATKRQVQLVHTVKAEMVASKLQEKSKILNPYYIEIIHKHEKAHSKSSGEATNSGEPLTKNGAPNKDKIAYKTSNKVVEKEIGAFGHSTQPTGATNLSEDGETEIPSDVLEVYLAFMKVMGSNSQDPDEDEKKLIGKALLHEGSENLLEAIHAYESELYVRDGSWRVLSTYEFFKRERYSRFLEKPHSEEPYFPLDDDDIGS